MEATSLGGAADLKARGNAAFKAGEIEAAIALYSECVDSLEKLAAPPSEEDRSFTQDLLRTCYQNLAAAHLKNNDAEAALRSADRCLEASGDNVKALFRKGRAQAMLGQHAEALVTLKTAAKLDPKNGSVRAEYRRVQALVDAAAAQLRKVEAEHADRVRAERKLSIKGRALKPLHSEFEVVAPIGEGNFCVVHHVIHEATGEHFALKVMSRDKVKRMRYRHKNIDNEIAMERKLMATFEHPNIIRLHASFADCNSLYLVMDFIPNGELWDRLCMPLRGLHAAPPLPPTKVSQTSGAEPQSNGKKLVGLPPSQARHVLAQLIVVLGYLREKGIVHRDLKPENMLLTPSGTLKLIDFGTAKDLVDPALNGGNEFVGTAEYMTPEAMLNRKADLRSDLWSLGSIVYQMHCGRPPFKSASGYLTMQCAMFGDVVLPKGFPPRAADLCRRLLRLSMAARLGAGDGPDLASVRAHPFFSAPATADDMHKEPPLATPRDWESQHSRGNRVPSLAELCRRSATEDIAECLMTRRNRAQLAEGLRPNTRAWLMHLLHRQERLTAEVHAQFFPSPLDARLAHARFGSVLGLSRTAEGEWDKSFAIAQLALPSGAGCAAQMERAVALLNASPPKVLVLTGPPDAARDADAAWRAALSSIDGAVHIVRLTSDSGRFSWWCGGVLCIAVDSALFARAGAAVWAGQVGPEATPEHAEQDADPERDMSDEARNARAAVKRAAKAAAAPYTGWTEGAFPPESEATQRAALTDRLWLEHKIFVGKLCAKHTLVMARDPAAAWLNPAILGRLARATNVAAVVGVGGEAIARAREGAGVPTLVEVPADGTAFATLAVKKSRVAATLIAVA